MATLLLSTGLDKLGLLGSPIHDPHINIERKAKIGFITLNLAPPVHIVSLKDILHVFLNHEFLRLTLVAVWLVICGFIESFLAQLSDIRYFYADNSMTKHPLRDLLHDALPKVADIQIVNYLLTATIVFTVVGILLQSPDWTTRFIVLRRWGFIMGFIYVFRGISLLITTLPSSLIDECRPPEIELSGTTTQRFAFLLDIIGGTALTCTDNIFSGHTSMMVSCILIWRVHSRCIRPISWLLYLIATSGILLILFTRFHYSIDVLLAIFITYTSWNIYLHYVQEASLHYVFGYRSNLDLFQAQFKTDAARIYQYLNYQPHPLGKQWIMYAVTFVDGVDIRFRALEISEMAHTQV